MIPEIIADRWEKAMLIDSALLWSGLAFLCGDMADTIHATEPGSEMGHDIRLLSHVAWQHYDDYLDKQAAA